MSKTLAMTPDAAQPEAPVRILTQTASWQDYFQLMKPRVMSLVVFTGLTGLRGGPRSPIHPVLGAIAVLCIAVGAGAAGRAEHVVRRRHRPADAPHARPPGPSGKVKGEEAASLGVVLSLLR
jgi:protoheme IX farnesyltransferase